MLQQAVERISLTEETTQNTDILCENHTSSLDNSVKEKEGIKFFSADCLLITRILEPKLYPFLDTKDNSSLNGPFKWLSTDVQSNVSYDIELSDDYLIPKIRIEKILTEMPQKGIFTLKLKIPKLKKATPPLIE